MPWQPTFVPLSGVVEAQRVIKDHLKKAWTVRAGDWRMFAATIREADTKKDVMSASEGRAGGEYTTDVDHPGIARSLRANRGKGLGVTLH